MLVCAAVRAGAQDQAPPPVAASTSLLAPGDLDQLLKPIALYPDPLLAEIFAAASVPEQIVLADRYVNQGGDLDQVSQQPWDASVQGLVHYPTVLKWLDDNLPWTTVVGQNFLGQQQAVMDSVQRLRAEAQAEGNLPSTPQENVVADDGTVEIEPADPDTIYVPYYSPDTIYSDPGVYCTFGVGFPIGFWLGYDWDWHNRHLIAWGPGHLRPADWWRRAPGSRVAPRGAPIWRSPSRGSAGFAPGADRGFAVQTSRTGRLVAPTTPAPAQRSLPRETAPPRTEAPAVVSRPPFENRAPVESRPAPVERAPSSVGAFGPENAAEARQSSVRGSESRGSASSGGGGRKR
jgi:hypothetical protein